MNKYKKIILENNIPLYLCVDPSMKNTFVSYNILYGSSGKWFNFNNKGKDYSVISGYAHYLEHLLGEHSQFGNMYDNFERRLQDANAFTADNVTSFHFKGLKDIEKSIQELILAIEQPVFEDKDVDKTRHAILEEAASYCDNPDILLVDMVQRNLYSGFDLFDKTLSPIGNRETTKKINTQDLYNCYDAFYTDDNKFLVIAGNVDEERIVDLVNNVYSKVASHKSHLVLPKIDYNGVKKKSGILYRNIDIPISSLGIKVRKPDSVSLGQINYVIDIIMNYLYSSKDYNDLNKNGTIDSFQYVYSTCVDNYINFIQSFVTKDKNLCCEKLYELLNKKEISNRNYELVKKGIIACDIRGMDDKYDYIREFPQKFYFSDDYSDIDFYRSIDYNTFMDTLSLLDFSEYTIGEVKKRKKVDKN